MELHPAKARYIYINDFFERYLTLNNMVKEINELENAGEIFKLTNSWERKGKEAVKRKIALEILKEGSSVDFVAKVTKLDIDEIEEMRKSN